MRRPLLAGLALALIACQSPRHESVVFGGEDGTCDDCHLAEYQTSAFDHGSVGYGPGCAECHLETTWSPIFEPEHDRFFQLLGRHAAAQCRSCHAPGRADPQPSDCVGCHAADAATAEPSHDGFPRACGDCHGDAAWTPAAFGDHDRWWPLDGAHAQTACGGCHVDEVYEGTPRDCVGCHAADRDAARPTHVRFDDTCTACHTQVAFSPATYDHRRFRVPHEGVRRCLDCHTDPLDYSRVGCTRCHEHRRSEVDPEHRGIRDYRYADAACLDCHPDGRD